MITLACNRCARDTSRAVVCQHSTWRAWSSLRTKTVAELAQSICSNYFLPTLSRYLGLNFETCNFLTRLVVELTLMKFERKYVARLLWAPPTPTDNFEKSSHPVGVCESCRLLWIRIRVLGLTYDVKVRFIVNLKSIAYIGHVNCVTIWTRMVDIF